MTEPTSTEIVVSRLDDLATPEADKLCQVAIEGDRVADRLDLEDWLHPLKLLGGTVCLGVTDATDGSFEAWYQMRSDTLHHFWRGGTKVRYDANTGVNAVNHFRFDSGEAERSVKPVPVEETPFMNGEGEDVR